MNSNIVIYLRAGVAICLSRSEVLNIRLRALNLSSKDFNLAHSFWFWKM